MGNIFKTTLAVCLGLALPLPLAGYNADVLCKEVQYQAGRMPEKTFTQKSAPETSTITETKAEKIFTGVEWTKEDEEKYALYKGSETICADCDNGGVYYVNWDYDNYLYYWKDGRIKLVLDKWVSQICYLDGMVYCIYDETGKSYDPDINPSYEGVICSVNVKTGEFKELAKTKAKRLAVCRDGIYYEWFTGPDAKEQKQKYGFYSFSDEKIHKISTPQENGVAQERYGKYAVIYRDGSYYIKDLENGNEQVFLPGSENAYNLYRCGDRCYYRATDDGKAASYTISFKDGKKQKIEDVLREPCIVQHGNGDYLYTSTGRNGKITVYSPGNNKCNTVKIKNTYTTSFHYSMGEMYSDGEYLYSMTKWGLVVLKADGLEVTETWSALGYDNAVNGRE